MSLRGFKFAKSVEIRNKDIHYRGKEDMQSYPKNSCLTLISWRSYDMIDDLREELSWSERVRLPGIWHNSQFSVLIAAFTPRVLIDFLVLLTVRKSQKENNLFYKEYRPQLLVARDKKLVVYCHEKWHTLLLLTLWIN